MVMVQPHPYRLGLNRYEKCTGQGGMMYAD